MRAEKNKHFWGYKQDWKGGGGWGGVPYSDAFLQPVSKKIHPGKNSSFAWCGALKQPDTTNKNVFACQGVCVVPSEVHCCAE